jgi:primosomal replication protein N
MEGRLRSSRCGCVAQSPLGISIAMIHLKHDSGAMKSGLERPMALSQQDEIQE